MTGAALPLLFSLGAASPALPVAVQLEGCAGMVDREQLLRLLRVELGELHPRAPEKTRVELTCAGGTATLSVRSGATGKLAQIALDLDRSAPIARQRIVALTVADLVQWAWADVGALSPPPVPALPSTTPPLAVVATAPAQPPIAGAAHALLTARQFLTAGQLLYGAGIGATAGRGVLALGADALFEQGVRESSLAAVTSRSLTLGARLVARRRLGAFALDVAAGGRWGRLSLAGAPRTSGLRAASVAGYGAGPELSVGAALRLLGPVRLGVAAAAGYLFGAVAGEVADVEMVTIGGPWMGVRLSLEVAR